MYPQPSVIARNEVPKQSRIIERQCFVFVCDKAVSGSSMWHFRWGVPSRMTVKGGEGVLVKRNVRAKDSLLSWIASFLAMTGEGEGVCRKGRGGLW
jgi:hypothetical protein